MQIGVDSSQAVANKRLFVVAGDDVVRMALQFMLHDEHETHALETLEAALDKARQWPPDLVLMGLAVVREKGAAALAEIKSGLAEAKLLIVADSAADPLAQACLQDGADGLLGQPLTVEAVRRKVDALLGRKRHVFIPLHAA